MFREAYGLRYSACIYVDDCVMFNSWDQPTGGKNFIDNIMRILVRLGSFAIALGRMQREFYD